MSEKLYSPKVVVKEWAKIDWPSFGTFCKTFGSVVIFTLLFLGYLMLGEAVGLWVTSL